MTWWFRRRRLWAALIGTTVAIGMAFAQEEDASPGPPKVGEVITLKFPDAPDRQFKVIKVEKQPDGSYLSEVKDTTSGETITLLDKPVDTPPGPPKKEPPNEKEPAAKGKARPTDPPATPDKSAAGGKTGSGGTKPGTTATTANVPDQPPQDPPKKPGLLARIFGPKKPNPPANPNPQNTATSPPPISVPSMPMPPAVLPTPGTFPPVAAGTGEPPRVPAVQPVAPPGSAPLFPAPSSIPVPPVTPTTPAPAAPAPMIPGLPSIPIPPPGDAAAAGPDVVQTQYVSPETAAMMQEIQPYVTRMRTAKAPSERIYSLRALANGRYGSTETVKTLIFRSCVADPCPLVRACCIDELCKLGYYDPAFLAHLDQATSDPSEDVQTAAKDALKKMTPEK